MAVAALGVRLLSGVACVYLTSGHGSCSPATTIPGAHVGCGTNINNGNGNGGGGGDGGGGGGGSGGTSKVGTSPPTTTTRARPMPMRRRCVGASRAVLRHRSTTAGEGNEESVSVSYEVHPVAGDGRCLFRSVAAARAVRGDSSTSSGGGGGGGGYGRRQSEAEESTEADRLREAAVDELIKRRAEVEWFLEGDFDRYCAAMRQPRAWGGEPEILMLTHVLKEPIEVFMMEETPDRGALRSIAHYGEDEYKGQEGVGVAVLFHGAGHYEALSLCET